MEARVVRLEEFAHDAGQRLARIETKLDQVAHDTGQFKWFMVGAALTMILTVLGTSIAIQQMTVATFQAAGTQQQAQPAGQQPIIINVPTPQIAPSIPAASGSKP